MAKKLRFELVENALDYVLSAAEQADEDAPRAWKYAVLHLFAGIELLLKERLRREHWSLLFADVNKASVSAIKNGDFKSVEFDVACSRLDSVAKVKIKKTDAQHLERLRKLRNRIQHFDAELEEIGVKAQLAIGLSFVISFCEAELKNVETKHAMQMNAIQDHLSTFDAYIKERLAAIKHRLKPGTVHYECPRCSQETVDPNDGDPYCLFCKQHVSAEDLAYFLTSTGDHSDPGGPEECPECEMMACVPGPDGDWICINCGEGGDYDRCLKCDRLFKRDEEETVCEACLGEAISHSD